MGRAPAAVRMAPHVPARTPRRVVFVRRRAWRPRRTSARRPGRRRRERMTGAPGDGMDIAKSDGLLPGMLDPLGPQDDLAEPPARQRGTAPHPADLGGLQSEARLAVSGSPPARAPGAHRIGMGRERERAPRQVLPPDAGRAWSPRGSDCGPGAVRRGDGRGSPRYPQAKLSSKLAPLPRETRDLGPCSRKIEAPPGRVVNRGGRVGRKSLPPAGALQVRGWSADGAGDRAERVPGVAPGRSQQEADRGVRPAASSRRPWGRPRMSRSPARRARASGRSPPAMPVGGAAAR